MKNRLVEYLLTVDAPTLSNAIEVMNLRPRAEGFTSLELRCLFPHLGRMCGYAVTAQVESVSQMGPLDGTIFHELFEAVDQSPKPAVVVYQEIGTNRDHAAHCGEVMATIFTRLGAVGLVSDCAVRDIPEVRTIGMHYFARGAAVSHAHFRIVRVGIPVQVCGVVIRPGDLLHGDENGLLLMPPFQLEELADAVALVRERERKLMNYVRSESFDLSGLRHKFLE